MNRKTLFFGSIVSYALTVSVVGVGNSAAAFSPGMVAESSESMIRDNRPLIVAENFIGGSGADTYVGTTGPDTAKGQSGKDSLYGGEGNDTLEGGSHADYLDGGPGSIDMCTGNSGPDTASNLCDQKFSI